MATLFCLLATRACPFGARALHLSPHPLGSLSRDTTAVLFFSVFSWWKGWEDCLASKGFVTQSAGLTTRYRVIVLLAPLFVGQNFAV